MFATIRKSFGAALLTGALTALSVTVLTSLAEPGAARDTRGDGVRARPAAQAPTWPPTGTVRVIDLRRPPADEPLVRTAKRDRGAA
jgi:hypothetical protein